ncbi:hypothetical protein D9M68_898490 [compost metagenome]
MQGTLLHHPVNSVETSIGNLGRLDGAVLYLVGFLALEQGFEVPLTEADLWPALLAL